MWNLSWSVSATLKSTTSLCSADFFLRENFSENKSSRWKCLKYILLEKFCCPSSKIIQKKFIRKYFIYLFYLYKNYFCLFVFLSFCYMVANFESSYRVTVCALIIPLCFPRRHTRKALSRYSPHIPGHMSFSPWSEHYLCKLASIFNLLLFLISSPHNLLSWHVFNIFWNKS